MRTLVLAAIAIVTATTSTWAADEPKAIIEKAIKAHGGADKLDKFLGYKATIKGTVDGMGNDVEMNVKLVGQHPDMAKVEGTISIGGQDIKLLQIVNGKKYNININGMKIDLPDDAKDDVQFAVYIAGFMQITPLLKPEFTLTVAPDADVDGKPASGVVVSRKDTRDLTIYFDKKTGLMVRMAYKAKTDKGEVNREETFSNYQDVKGLQTPHHTVRKDDGKTTQDLTISDYEVLEKVDAAEFKINDD